MERSPRNAGTRADSTQGGPARHTYRAEVVGSLLRPDYLKQAVARHQAGAASEPELRAAQDRAVREALTLQEEAGIEAVTDGEMRRSAWTDPLTAGFEGFGRAEQIGLFSQEGPRRSLLPALTGPIAPRSNLPLREALFARAHTQRTVKPTMPSPSYASMLYVPGVSEAAYPSREQFLAELLPQLRRLVGELVEAGFDYIQLDCPRYSALVMEETRARLRELGLDPWRWFERMIELDNELIDAFPQVTWAMHVCRGNHQSTWYAEGGYDPIAERLFGELHVQRFFLEYDTPRAGTFEPLRYVTGAKIVVLGLLTTKQPEVEPDELVIRRIEEASRYLPLERLALSPQCGFASTFPGNKLDNEAQRRKLEAVGRVARAVWG
ncbi:MAG TPA: cobalamin-independent methionine synthase II family protein [Solirubrobacteraceae bacterium]|nr:cobalamin-independent methionine synthase II family protein [Solirubrobacteraceae bacterium]